ncbi:hypothetical protein [Streptococcus halichoeri]|uniref:hypothetical protein n=1 Tax=Streptococcus halichoeri TaxID=254785 RepID=UPI001359672D|nr:hypothetical protein [Streptococcus halichoeri]
MAKHHWSKKAVLASLMLGASVLVTSIGVKAEDSNHEILNHKFDKQISDLIQLGEKNRYTYNGTTNTDNSDELLRIPKDVQNILSHLRTTDLQQLLTEILFNTLLEDKHYILHHKADKLFNLNSDNRYKARQLYSSVSNSGLEFLLTEE